MQQGDPVQQGGPVQPGDAVQQGGAIQRRSRREGFPLREGMPFVHLQHWCRFKHFMKPLVLHVEACLLEKIFGPSRVLLPGFEREFKVVLQVGEPDSDGMVEILISGTHWYRKRAKRLIHILAARSRRKQSGGTVMLGLESMKSLETEDAQSSAFLSAEAMSSLDKAMQSLEIGRETVGKPVTKAL
ncbi:developmental pluripotency-associated 5 protein-like [Loxodonta africana]|uniref:developmental pluripotency-associated 5 protein-like n=1 Tax=Loxodonta africana TaxID=9785 RepID=UPI000C813496|nr:developmental pluripotency-associated 5 protein-like isoform X1 [Loxodonta africana]XP_023400171.1 developmental pluripotency-associated 5 protein-like isoform X1 [Loxodonta africana]XP_023400174.1 developmental pluripotency-associated 5 protein-like isoform X1 [Loxodonta africana]